MSLQTILEGDTHKGAISAESIQSRSLHTESFLGAGEIVTAANAATVGAGLDINQLVTIPDTLIEGDVYLVLWEALATSLSAQEIAVLLITFDLGGQGAGLGTSEQSLVATGVAGSTLLSGFGFLTITAAGVGAGKQINFNLASTKAVPENVVLSNSRISLIKISSVPV